MKVRVFVDFWNFQLNWNETVPGHYRVDWLKLPQWLVGQAAGILERDLQYQGTRVYASYDPRGNRDGRFRDFMVNTLDRLPGIEVTLKERKTKKSPTCQNCHQQIDACPHCGSSLQLMNEKGVDTAIVTDMMNLAWEGSWETAVLVSSDRDYIPVVQALSVKGYQVINAHFPPQGADLARTCWAGINLRDGIEEYRRKQ